jgi:hypothetical protein
MSDTRIVFFATVFLPYWELISVTLAYIPDVQASIATIPFLYANAEIADMTEAEARASSLREPPRSCGEALFSHEGRLRQRYINSVSKPLNLEMLRSGFPADVSLHFLKE